MKTTIAIMCLSCVVIQLAMADIPSAFDPRPVDRQSFEGCGFIIHPMPLTDSYIIICRPDDPKPKSAFLAFEASADSSLKLDSLVGQFVLIKATRVKPTRKDGPTLRIDSAVRITRW